MPKGPRGERRPADVIGNAVKVMRIAAREEEDDRKTNRQTAPGRRDGVARAKALTKKQRSKITKKAAAKRWGG